MYRQMFGWAVCCILLVLAIIYKEHDIIQLQLYQPIGKTSRCTSTMLLHTLLVHTDILAAHCT